jgi:hypothetical protein
MLSNLGAIEENKAVSMDVLYSSDLLKKKPEVLDDEIGNLISSGYVKSTDGKYYLTKAGLFRALSRFS